MQFVLAGDRLRPGEKTEVAECSNDSARTRGSVGRSVMQLTQGLPFGIEEVAII